MSGTISSVGNPKCYPCTWTVVLPISPAAHTPDPELFAVWIERKLFPPVSERSTAIRREAIQPRPLETVSVPTHGLEHCAVYFSAIPAASQALTVGSPHLIAIEANVRALMAGVANGKARRRIPVERLRIIFRVRPHLLRRRVAAHAAWRSSDVGRRVHTRLLSPA